MVKRRTSCIDDIDVSGRLRGMLVGISGGSVVDGTGSCVNVTGSVVNHSGGRIVV